MSLLVKITLSAALILSIGVPFGAFAAGEKTRGRYKTALGANLFLFFGTMVIAAVLMFNGNAFAAEEAASAAGSASSAAVWVTYLQLLQLVFPVWAAVLQYLLQPAQR